jgi:3-dehydroquinate dehydratase-2
MSPIPLLVLQGPNLNLLGQREPAIYGSTTLAEIASRLDACAAEVGAALTHVQSNSEGALIDAVHAAAAAGCRGAIVNAGGYTHTSVALRDALVGAGLPFVEVHLSNVYAREPFRRVSLLAEVSIGAVTGLGPIGYELALRGLLAHLR